MHALTSNLPLVEDPTDSVDLIGKSTETSILSGVINGIKEEIKGITRLYRNKFANLQIIFTGGHSLIVGDIIEDPNEYVPHLVLEGLNGILRYNVYSEELS